MMKRVIPLLLAMLTGAGASAFDSAVWLGKRELFAREAERLQAAYRDYAAKSLKPAEELVIPLETYDDGSVKTVITAERAQYFADRGMIWAEGVTVRKQKEDGSTEAEIRAGRCLIDRHTKSGWAEGPATVHHGKTSFRGSGIYFSSAESYVKILSDAEIESKDLKFGEVRR